MGALPSARTVLPSLQRLLCLSGLLLLSMLPTRSQAQITLDGSLGPRGALRGPNYLIPDSVGQIRGPNLFHSFGQFNLSRGESATFTGPNTIANIIGRVTGGSPSNIDGTIQSRIPGANLYMLNPSGALFGPNASLDVSGSFHVSTADFLRFADGATFSAHLSEKSTLTVAPPSAFGFLGPTPAPITILHSSLLVPPGETLSVVGGDIAIAGNPELTNPQPPFPGLPTLGAPGGRIHLASVASAGEVSVNLSVRPPFGAFERLGQITLAPNTLLDVSGIGAGAVVIRGGHLRLDNATIIALTLAADGGEIGMAVDTATLTGGSVLSSGTFGPGRGGRISLTATDAIVIAGRRADGRRSGLSSFSSGLGDAGDILLSAPKVSLDDGALISASTLGLDGHEGDAGNIVMNVGRFTLTGGSLIDSSTILGAGQGGAVTITATDAVVIAGRDRFLSSEGLFVPSTILSATDSNSNAGRITLSAPVLHIDDGLIGTSTFGFGRGGDIVVEVGTLRLLNGARIDSSSRFGFRERQFTVTTGAGGTVTVAATQEVSIMGRASDGTPSGLLSQAESGGDAGQVTILAPTVHLHDGGVIETATRGEGKAGNIRVEAGRFALTGGAQISSSTAGLGQGGVIEVTADTVTIRDMAAIRSSTNGDAPGGLVTVTAREATTIHEDAGIFTESTGGRGRGGDITLQAHSVQLTDGAIISAKSSGAGNAGSIRITAMETFRSENSAVTTEASQATGGNIRVTASALVHLQDSQITATVNGGAGDGGNVTIDPDFIILQGSQITANAFAGTGGRISLTASKAFLADPSSVVTASSTLGINGEVNIQAPVTSISGAVAPLPQAFAQTAEILRSRCAERLREGTVSRFVIGGRDGVPLEPGSLLLSPLERVGQEGRVQGEERASQNPEAQHGRVWYAQAHAPGGLEVECARWRGKPGTAVTPKQLR